MKHFVSKPTYKGKVRKTVGFLIRFSDMITPEEFDELVEKSQMFLSDSDFRRLLHDPKIVKYSELKNYKNFEELLPSSTDYVIVLVESKKNSGHWCCLLRKDKMITEFDSYGSHIDHETDFVTRMLKTMLGENKKEIARLQKASPGFEMIHNKLKLQSDKPLDNQIPEPSTCGRWVAAMIQYFLMGFDLGEFQRFIKEKSKQKFDDLLPLDILICVIVPSP